MSHAAARRGPSLAGILVVALFVAFALAGPAVILAERLGGGGGSPAPAEGDTVSLAGLRFQPATLTVPKGTTVVFANDDTAPHTVTARSGAPSSGVIDPGRSFTVVAASSFDYFCSVHPSMTAKLVVSG